MRIRSVLLIDDDGDDIELFQEALEEIHPDHYFQHYQNAQVALNELISSRHGLPEIIFLDINLPILGGWEFLRRIKNLNQLRHIPVYIFSTTSNAKQQQLARELGAAGFITKPGDYNHLKKILKDILFR